MRAQLLWLPGCPGSPCKHFADVSEVDKSTRNLAQNIWWNLRGPKAQVLRPSVLPDISGTRRGVRSIWNPSECAHFTMLTVGYISQFWRSHTPPNRTLPQIWGPNVTNNIYILTHEYSSAGFEQRLVFEIVQFGEPDWGGNSDIWCRNLAIKKTVRKPPLSNKSYCQFSYAARCFMPKIVSYQTTPVWFVKNEYLIFDGENRC